MQEAEDVIERTSKSLITVHRKIRILSAIQELQPLISKYSEVKNLDLLWKLISSKSINELGSVQRHKLIKRIRVSTQHGDLHCGNILVVSTGRKNRPKIIDYANINILPWMTDVVRFLVDIIVSGLDNGTASYEWENLTKWISVCEFLALDDKKLDFDNSITTQTSCWAAIIWIRANVFQICGLEHTDQNRAEYLLALGLEFSRASYRKEELTAPKRALGLIAAELILKRAEIAFLSTYSNN
jgi:hypothetical protein